MDTFVPKIVAFCCNYCAYAAADLAGVSRMQYPTNVRIIRVPCSGKVDITYILRAFESGADGVVVAGCLKGGCHFVEGNLHAETRVKFTKELLEAVGLGNRMSHIPGKLSGGERQRVAIASALMNNPSLVLADEPTGELDSETGYEIIKLLFSLCRKHKTTVVVATHDERVAKVSDVKYSIRDGMITQDGR